MAYVMDFETLKFGFTPAKLPTFWNDGLSTGMAGLDRAGGGTLLG
jgi:hypothetical protein